MYDQHQVAEEPCDARSVKHGFGAEQGWRHPCLGRPAGELNEVGSVKCRGLCVEILRPGGALPFAAGPHSVTARLRNDRGRRPLVIQPACRKLRPKANSISWAFHRAQRRVVSASRGRAPVMVYGADAKRRSVLAASPSSPGNNLAYSLAPRCAPTGSYCSSLRIDQWRK